MKVCPRNLFSERVGGKCFSKWNLFALSLDPKVSIRPYLLSSHYRICEICESSQQNKKKAKSCFRLSGWLTRVISLTCSFISVSIRRNFSGRIICSEGNDVDVPFCNGCCTLAICHPKSTPFIPDSFKFELWCWVGNSATKRSKRYRRSTRRRRQPLVIDAGT